MKAAHLDRLRLLHPVRWRLAAALACMLAAVLLQLAIPRGIAYGIDNVARFARDGIPAALIVAMVAVVLLFALATMGRLYLFQTAGYRIVTNVRRRFFAAVINQPIAFHDRHHVGELGSRLASDVPALHDSLTGGAANLLRSLCLLAGALAMLLHISPALSLPLVLLVPASLYLGKVSGSSYRARARALQASLADSGKVAQEHFANVRLVHAFNQQTGALARYARATAALLQVSVANARTMALYAGLAMALTWLATLVTLCYGVHLIARGDLSVGQLTAFVLYAGMLTDSASSASEFWNGWMRSLGATDRVFELLTSEAAAPVVNPAAARLSGRIGLHGVRFSYPERPGAIALDGIDLEIAPGEKVALVGASGAGKSTLANLVLGHYAPDAGQLRFDGIDAATLGATAIRSHMAIVEQEPALFSGTIAENIAFAVPERDVTQAELADAARLAHAHDFISAFPDGYATRVGEGGAQLSGGQKQRIAIARALLRNPSILILDEATSALDAASERLVQDALDKLMEGRTTIIIAHRFSTIARADRIVVMEAGRIGQAGSHAELVGQDDGPYLRLMRSQMGADKAGATCDCQPL
jgi:ATP-binding cassette subfamily B protein